MSCIRPVDQSKPNNLVIPGQRLYSNIYSASRSCTDVVCCLVFAAFLAVWIVVAAFAIYWGNPEKLVFPTDSLGQICGSQTKFYNMSSKPYLHFFDITRCFSYATVLEGCLTPQVCVERCPSEYYVWPSAAYYSHLPQLFDSDKLKLVCTYDVHPENFKTADEAQRAIDAGLCARYYVKTAPVAGRCISDILANVLPAADEQKLITEMVVNASAVSDTDGNMNITAMGTDTGKNFVKLLLQVRSIGQKLLADMQVAWWQMLVALLAASIVAFIWIALMRWIAAFMIYLSMLIVLLASAAGGTYCWLKFVSVHKAEGSGAIQFRITINWDSYLDMSGTWLAFAIICTTAFAIFALSLLCICSRIRLAILLIGESSKAVASMLSALFFPIFPFILHLGVFTYAATVAVYLASSGRPQCRRFSMTGNYTNETCDCDDLPAANASEFAVAVSNSSAGNLTLAACQFVNYTSESYIIYMQLINLFGFFWAMFFVDGLAEMTLAGAFASYYWAFRKPVDVPALPVIKSFWTTIRYHIGTLAFGSLILAIVRIIRVILEYLESKLKTSTNPIAQGFMKCMQCFFYCLEKFLRALSKNAYIMVAIYGRNFCVSAHEAFSLIMRNILRYVVLNKITDFLLFLGKVVITGGIGAASYFYFAGYWTFNEFLIGHLNYYFVPVIIIVLGTYVICSIFFGVYEIAVDTIFLCFLEDCERNDGSLEKPYYMAKTLKVLLDKHNEVQKP